MTPKKFDLVNVTYAENQPEYLPLPAFRDADGTVVTCWHLSWRERFRMLFKGELWVVLMTFNKPLQPIFISDKRTEVFKEN